MDTLYHDRHTKRHRSGRRAVTASARLVVCSISERRPVMKTLRVLVPIDGSTLSEAVVRFVPDLAAAEVTLLRVLDDASDAARRIAAELDLLRVAEGLRAAGVGEVKLHVRGGKPGDEILAAADEYGS